MMRLFADHYLSTVAAVASPGCDEVPLRLTAMNLVLLRLSPPA